MRVSKGCMESILDKFLVFHNVLQTHNTYFIRFPEAKVSRLDSLGVVRTSSHHARRYILNTA